MSHEWVELLQKIDWSGKVIDVAVLRKQVGYLETGGAHLQIRKITNAIDGPVQYLADCKLQEVRQG